MRYPKALAMTIFLCVAVTVLAQESERPLPTPGTVMQTLEQSAIKYVIEPLDSAGSAALRANRPLMDHFTFRHSTADGNDMLTKYAMSDALVARLSEADSAFAAAEFDLAIQIYRDAYGESPDFHKALTFIGNCFFAKHQYDSARYYLEQAIEKNFVDYQAHWFLSNASWQLGDSARAVDEATTAHLLNVNHDDIGKSLKYYRSAVGREWEDWMIDPAYAIERSPRENNSDEIQIKVDMDWMMFAFSCALWRHEPGYAPPDYTAEGARPDPREYKEAFAVWLQGVANAQEADPPNTSFADTYARAMNAVDAGQFEFLVWYAIIAKEHPDMMLRVDPASFEAIKAFVDRY